jgi:Beta-propeller repeat
MLHKSRFWWILCAVSGLHGAPAPDTGVVRAKAALAQLPLRFESNQGQWNADVRFRARTGAYAVALTGRGASLSLAGGQNLEISMRGANASPAIEPSQPQAARTNYFIGPKERWHTGVVNYSRVAYRGVYPGIDVVYYGNGQQLEYDFALAPGADARAIRMEFRGAGSVRVTPAGDLEVEAGGERLLQKKPAIYQDGRAIAGRYRLLGHNLLGVRVGGYDHSRQLVIDPILAYATYVGADATAQIAAVRLDAQGRLYITGSASNSDMGYTDGGYDNFDDGLIDTFVAIIDTTGSLTGSQYGLMYLTYVGGSNNDIPTAMQIDSQGDIYVTGNTTSTDFPTVGNQLAAASATVTMGFVYEISPAIYGGNSLLYSSFVGGVDGSTFPYAIDLDANGNIYLFGTTQTDDFPVTASAYQAVLWGPADMFLAELNPGATSYLYATYLGGELSDDGRAMAVTPGGLVYFAGTTHSTQFPLAGNAYQNNLSGGGQIDNYDLVVGVIDPTQNGTDSLVYCTYLGGSDNEELRAMALDSKGNMVLTGYTLSVDFPVTKDAAQPSPGGNGDVFVTVVNPKANASAFLVYSTYLGGSDGEVGYGVASDSQGYLYVTGYTLSADFPVQNAPQPGWGGLVDVFITKLKPGVAGRAGIQFSTYIGGATLNQGNALKVGPNGTVYTGGYTGGEFPTTQNASQHDFGGGAQNNGFLLILTQQ